MRIIDKEKIYIDSDNIIYDNKQNFIRSETKTIIKDGYKITISR